MSTQEPNEDEMRAALEEQMRRITVQDVLVQTVVTLINLGGRRLGLAGPPEQAGDQDMEQARLAIEGARALVPLLPQEADLGPVRDALSQLQMAYVQLSQAEKAEAEREAGGQGAGGRAQGAGAEGSTAPPASDGAASGASQPSPEPAPSAADEAERAKARAKIWTPPGA